MRCWSDHRRGRGEEYISIQSRTGTGTGRSLQMARGATSERDESERSTGHRLRDSCAKKPLTKVRGRDRASSILEKIIVQKSIPIRSRPRPHLREWCDSAIVRRAIRYQRIAERSLGLHVVAGRADDDCNGRRWCSPNAAERVKGMKIGKMNLSS
jgi:hypothetical protein